MSILILFVDDAFNKLSAPEKIDIIAKENNSRSRSRKGGQLVTAYRGVGAPRVYVDFLVNIAENWTSQSKSVRDKMVEAGFDYSSARKHSTENRNARFEALAVAVIDYREENGNTLPPVSFARSHGKASYQKIKPGSPESWLSNQLCQFQKHYTIKGGAGMSSDANAALLALLGLKQLVMRKITKSKKGNGYLLCQPSGKIIELVFEVRVGYLLSESTGTQVNAIVNKSMITLLGHLLVTTNLKLAQDGATGSEQVIDLAQGGSQVTVEWLDKDEGHVWCIADVSSTNKPHHEVTVGSWTIKIPVYKLVYCEGGDSHYVAFLSDTRLVDIEDGDEPFYQFSREIHLSASPQHDSMPFDYDKSLKCTNELEMKRYVARCMHTTLLRRQEVLVTEEDQMQFVSAIQNMVGDVVDGLKQLRFKSRNVSKNTPGEFGTGPVEGTAIVTADNIISILEVADSEINSIINSTIYPDDDEKS